MSANRQKNMRFKEAANTPLMPFEAYFRTCFNKVYTYYICLGHTHGRDCPHKTDWREDHVEAALLTSLKLELQEYLADIKKLTREDDTDAQVIAEELRTKQARLKELYVEGLIQRDDFDVRYAELDT